MKHSNQIAAGPGAARYGLFVLFVVALFNYIDRSIVSVLQVPIKHDLHLSDTQLGAITGLSFALVYTTLAIPIARLADVTVRKRLIAVALAIWSGMTALSGLATGFLMLVGFRLGVAFGEAGCVPATHSMISDYYPRSRRASALALWGLSSPAGVMIGFFSGGWLTQALNWRLAFLIVGGLGVALAPLVLTMREPRRGQSDPAILAKAEPIPLPVVIATLWRLKSFRWLAVGGALTAYVQLSMQTWDAPFFARVHHMPIRDVAFYLALMFGLGGGAGQMAGGYVADLLGRRDRRWYLWLPGLAGLALIPAAAAQLLAPSAMASVWFGFGPAVLTMVYFAPIVAVAQSLVAAPMRAFTTATLVLVVNLIGLGLGPLFTGAISDLLTSRYGLGADGLRYAMLSALVCAPAAAFAFWRSAKWVMQELPEDLGAAVASSTESSRRSSAASRP
ncbi:MAG TPA: MFS transporter [Caulobacteraceae bacterium]